MEYLNTLVIFWQRNHGLKVDGIIGRKTRASLDKHQGSMVGLLDMPTQGSKRMNRIISLCLADVGKGGIGGNNAGPYVRGLRRFCGFPEWALGAWCAIFASAKTKAAFVLTVPLSRGAYRFVMNVGESPGGEFIDVPEPGFACWERKGWILFRKAHVRVMTGYDASTDTMHYVAGNEGDEVAVGSLRNGAWRKGLLKMATLR